MGNSRLRSFLQMKEEQEGRGKKRKELRIKEESGLHKHN